MKPILLLLSNINVDGIAKRLSSEYEVVVPEGYNTWVQHFAGNSGILDSKIDACCLILDGDELFRNIDGLDDIKKEIGADVNIISNAVQQHPHAKFFVSNIDVNSLSIKPLKHISSRPSVEFFWEEEIRKIVSVANNAYLLDLKKLITEIGRNQFYSSKLWYLGGMKYSMVAEDILTRELSKLCFFMSNARKKCIVLDLDNTLWGGVLGEDGLSGISLSDYKEGARFKDFQRVLKQIKDTGVMLCACSKNNEGEVLEAIEKHPHMVLRKNDFVALKINWNNKDINIAEICRELNIGIDSIVFIDDNPFERDLVKTSLPGLTVPDFPKDTLRLPEFAVELYDKYFFKLDQTDEDNALTAAYAANYKRKHLQESCANYADFLNSLEMKIRIWKATSVDIPRIHQLVQKTNQFNLTTMRYSEKEIASMASDKSTVVYCLSVSDRFGDNGMVGVLVVRLDDAESLAEIDSFILSCRVMGREIEISFLGTIENSLFSKRISRIQARYVRTQKNLPVENLFEKAGYDVSMKAADNSKYYELTKEKYLKIADDRKYYGSILADNV